MVAAGVIRTNPKWPFERRLMVIAGGLRELIREHKPELAAVEEVFHAVNAKSALRLAHVRGVALLVVGEAGLGLAEYSPLEVKMSVVGYGRAEKSQVQMMVRSLLGLAEAWNRWTPATPWRWPFATPRTKPPAVGWGAGGLHEIVASAVAGRVR